MSSLKNVTLEIERFLTADNPEAICISGEWGIGKTYTWDRIYQKVVSEGRISKKFYSYASLFGISNLETLKNVIFENTQIIVDPNNTDPELSSILRYSDKVIRFAKSNKSLLASIPFVGKAISEADKLYFASVRNQFVCIDDLERRGAALSVRDVLGLISFLKEQRKCKVILLLNDGQLGDSEKEFRENFEKVFDAALRFRPTPEESADVVFNSNDPFEKKLRENCIKLNIANIRVISKVQRFGDLLRMTIDSMSDEVATQAAASLTLFCFARFLPKDAPSIDYLLNGHLRGLMRTREGEISQDEKVWRTTLSAFGFMSADDFDKAILTSIDNGFFDAEVIAEQTAKLVRNLKLSGRNSPLARAWNLFRYSLDDNADEVVDAMIKGIAETEDVSPGNLDASVRLIKQLGRQTEAGEVITRYVARHADADARFWDLSNHHTGEVSDPDIISAFELKKLDAIVPPDPKAILLRIAEREGYDPAEIAYLATLPVASFQELIQNAKGDDLLNIISGGLFFTRLSEPDGTTVELIGKVKQALQNISSSSTINALRIQNITGIALRR